MNTIRIHISGNFQDGYLYGGQLFLIENNGELKTIPFWDLLSKNLIYNSEEYAFFEFIFSRNNWLKNEQAVKFLKIKGFKENFDRLWNKFSKIHYNFIIKDVKSLKHLQSLECIPTFDFKVYGMRMFIGNRNGLYETGFSINNNDLSLNNKLQRVFDSRSTSISAKSGSVMISSNADGLFHGQLTNIGKPLQVKEKPICGTSLRSGWSGYDVVNYETQSNFDYLKSEFSKTTDRQYLFSDEVDTKKISIDNIGSQIYSLSELLSNSNIKEEDITYSFNSSTYCFFFLTDGSLRYLSFRKDIKNNQIKLSSKTLKLPKGLSNSNKPISSKVIPNGCVIEYFDKVILIHNNKRLTIENQSVISIKTYPNSIRYKNLITIFDGSGVVIHSVYPF